MNSFELARRWTSFLASRTDISNSALLLQHFDKGAITRLCDCGCNSYDLVVPADSGLEPLLAPRARGGCGLSIAFHLRASPGSIEFNVFLDGSGYLAGVDVAFNANSEPVPDDPQMLDSPYHIHGPLVRAEQRPAGSGGRAAFRIESGLSWMAKEVSGRPCRLGSESIDFP
jgi:hypothetical protein